MKANTRAHLAVLCTNLFFAANFSLVKLVSPVPVGAFALNLLRAGCSVVLFWGLWLWRRPPAGFERKDLVRFLLCGLTGVTVNQMLFIKGLTLTSTVHASLLMLVTPLLVTVAAFWVLREPFSPAKVVGLLLGVGGALLLIVQKESGQHATNYLLGDVLVVINAASYSLYFILVKPLMQRYSAVHVIRWTFTFGLLFMLPFTLADAGRIQWAAFGWQHAAALTFIIVCGTFLAYIFNAYGLQHIGAGATGSYIYTQPVFAVVIAMLLLGETFSWQKGVAAALIFCGVFLVNAKRRQ